MLAVVRKNRVLAQLEQKGAVRTRELAQTLGVVPETIRRDLFELEQKGLVRRIHGGAVTPSSGEIESPASIREGTNTGVKNELCRAAATQVRDGDLIFVDNSSTLLHLARHIDDSRTVSVLTNSVRLLLEAQRLNQPNVTMISTGGILSTYNLSLSGQLDGGFADALFPTKAFVSCTGFSLESGFTDTSVFEINIKRRMISAGARFIMVMDHSKFEKRGLVKIGNLKDCDMLITDHLPGEIYRGKLLAMHPALQIIETDAMIDQV